MSQNHATVAIQQINIILPNGLPFIYLPDLHLTCELSEFEVKISFEILQLSPTPISLNLLLLKILPWFKRTRRKIGGAIPTSFLANMV